MQDLKHHFWTFIYFYLGVIGLDKDGKNKDFQESQEVNPFEEQLREIDEWQSNSANPGYFIDKGRAPLPIRNLNKTPILMIAVGILFAIPTLFFILGDFCLGSILSSSVMIVISVSFISGGCLRLKRKGSDK